jgi:membrane fusion protein (multidrug efflux system)
VGPATPVGIRSLSTRRELRGTIARRSPAADVATRTVHVEIDVPDAARSLPVGTTAELDVDVGEPVSATEIPLVAASVRGASATIFVVDGGKAHKRVCGVKGERGASLFVEPSLNPGARVVTEGRAGLKDGDRIEAKLEDETPPPGRRLVGASL